MAVSESIPISSISMRNSGEFSVDNNDLNPRLKKLFGRQLPPFANLTNPSNLGSLTPMQIGVVDIAEEMRRQYE